MMSESPDLVNTNIGLMMLKPEIVAEVLTFLANFLTARWAVSSRKMCVFLITLGCDLAWLNCICIIYCLQEFCLEHRQLWLWNKTTLNFHLSLINTSDCQTYTWIQLCIWTKDRKHDTGLSGVSDHAAMFQFWHRHSMACVQVYSESRGRAICYLSCDWSTEIWKINVGGWFWLPNHTSSQT